MSCAHAGGGARCRKCHDAYLASKGKPQVTVPAPTPPAQSAASEQGSGDVRTATEIAKAIATFRVLADLHGADKAAVMLLTGLSSERIDEIGGVSRA